MTITLRGLTWDHPRAVLPLMAALEPMRTRFPDIRVHWDRQSLAYFESRPLEEAAQRYDLVVFDHPHVGEVARARLFLPVDSSLRAWNMSDWDFVGPTLGSYRFEGQTWGLPLDAACQVSSYRPDLVESLGVVPPTNWQELLEYGVRARHANLKLAIAFAGVHSLMVLLTLTANQHSPLISESSPFLQDRSSAYTALAAMRNLLELCPADVLDWNSIALLEAMASRDDLVFCPAVYGFSPYSTPTRTGRLEFANFIGLRNGGEGSTLGGAGLGVSATASDPSAAFAVAHYLIDAATQRDVIALNSGQPAHTAAWNSSEVDGACGGFFSGTRRSMEHAWVRPRFEGYLEFQRTGGVVVEDHLRGKHGADETLDLLEQSWATCKRHVQ